MHPDELQHQRITIIGAARSGLAAARLLTEAGAEVFVTDHSPATEEARSALEEIGVDYEFDGHSTRAFEADFFVISPGVPTTAPLVQNGLQRGIPVFSEVELASWFCELPIVAVTGSNGKTTTTSLLGHLFETAGLRPLVAGNIGHAFADGIREPGRSEVVVLEVSSFQLDHINSFHPRVAVLLNITPDHLDRYQQDFDHYLQSKLRIFANQRAGDTFIYNADDPLVRAYALPAARERGVQAYGISTERELERGAFVREGQIILRTDEEEELMPLDELSLRGRHNLYNALASAVAGRAMDVKGAVLRKSLESFAGVPHRLESVRVLEGVRYVNDSKATNVNAVWYALEAFEEPIVLIAGGRDKGNDYDGIRPLVKERVRVVIAIGESADKVEEELGPDAEVTLRAETMKEAVRQARDHAREGEVVLLSPACSSFDMFDDYEDRGDTFRRLVNDLA